MSAMHLGPCPRCKRRADAAADELARTAGEAYGKVSAAEYLRLSADAAKARAVARNAFGESWEVYPADDENNYAGETGEAVKIVVDYGAECSACGFSVSFRYIHHIEGIEG